MDSEGVITDWNPKAKATFGWSREEAVGRDLADTIIPESHREPHRRGIERFLATGEARSSAGCSSSRRCIATGTSSRSS